MELGDKDIGKKFFTPASQRYYTYLGKNDNNEYVYFVEAPNNNFYLNHLSDLWYPNMVTRGMIQPVEDNNRRQMLNDISDKANEFQLRKLKYKLNNTGKFEDNTPLNTDQVNIIRAFLGEKNKFDIGGKSKSVKIRMISLSKRKRKTIKRNRKTIKRKQHI